MSGDSGSEGSKGKLAQGNSLSRDSDGEDFEDTAEPRANDGLGDADDLRHISAASSRYDPHRDVVLRMECSTDRGTKVNCYALSSPSAPCSQLGCQVQGLIRRPATDRASG